MDTARQSCACCEERCCIRQSGARGHRDLACEAATYGDTSRCKNPRGKKRKRAYREKVRGTLSLYGTESSTQRVRYAEERIQSLRSRFRLDERRYRHRTHGCHVWRRRLRAWHKSRASEIPSRRRRWKILTRHGRARREVRKGC